MNRAQFAHRYTGAPVMPFAPGHFGPGMCRSCGKPSGDCCCGCRECRKEARHLTVEAGAKGVRMEDLFTMAAAQQRDPTSLASNTGALAGNTAGTLASAGPTPGLARAFIGGGCCVHLSIEYAPIVPTAAAVVGVLVSDSEGTVMLWGHTEPAGGHYEVKENIITTKPGATVLLVASNATARLRWCEIFSC